MSEWYAFENGYPTRHDPGFRLTDGAALAHPAKRLNRVVDEREARARGARLEVGQADRGAPRGLGDGLLREEARRGDHAQPRVRQLLLLRG